MMARNESETHQEQDHSDTRTTGYDLEGLKRYVQPRIENQVVAARLVHVLTALPTEIVAGLLDDPCFHVAMDNAHLGRGRTVWMACPSSTDWRGSRSVVLKHRLGDCTTEFAYYVIAHELAHAHLWNGGWGTITDPEEAADALAAAWGFPKPN